MRKFVRMIKFLLALIVVIAAIISINPSQLPIFQTPTPTATIVPTSTPTIGEIFDIPGNYYDLPFFIPSGENVQSWFSHRQWIKEYNPDNFDCSNMAAFTEFVLENSGYTARFALGEAGGGKHAWLEVRLGGQWFIFESTELEFRGLASNNTYYKHDFYFEDIYELAEFYYPNRTKQFIREFVWWVE